MSRLLKPFTDFLDQYGIDVILISVIIVGVSAFLSIKTFKTWKKLEKRERVDIILIWIFFVGLFVFYTFSKF